MNLTFVPFIPPSNTVNVSFYFLAEDVPEECDNGSERGRVRIGS